MIKKLRNRILQFSRHPLAGKNIFRAVFRYLLFHIRYYFFPQPAIYSFPAGVKFFAAKGMAGIVGNVYTGLYEFEEMGFLLHYLNENDTFLDVGANVGAFSLLASGINGANTIAIEPVPGTYQQLVRNIRLNRLEDKVACLPIGLSETQGRLAFSQNKGAMNRVVLDAGNSVEVEVKTLDQLVQENNVTPEFLKIDVEGFEMSVLRGGRLLIARPECNALIVELNGSGERYGFSDEEVHQLLQSNHFNPVSYDPFSRSFKVLPSFNKDKFNTIYLKDVEKAISRVKQAPRIKVFSQMI